MSSSSSSSSSSTLAAAAAGAASAAAAGAAAANLLGSARNSLSISASLKVMSVTAAMARRFFMPLAMLCGAEAMVGYPISSHELVLDVIIGDVKNLGAEHGALVVDLLD